MRKNEEAQSSILNYHGHHVDNNVHAILLLPVELLYMDNYSNRCSMDRYRNPFIVYIFVRYYDCYCGNNNNNTTNSTNTCQ